MFGDGIQRGGERKDADGAVADVCGTLLLDICVERIGGFEAPAREVAQRSPAAAGVVETRAAEREAACAMLERRVRSLFDADEVAPARSLIAFKRALFNGRVSSLGQVPTGIGFSREEESVISAAIVPSECDTSSSAVAWPSGRDWVERAIESPQMRAALHFTDRERPRLLRRTREDGRPVKPGEMRKNRIALTQFAARAAFKTTPFSFLGTTRLHVAEPAAIHPAPFEAAVVSLDGALTRRLTWTVLLRVAEIRRMLRIGLNPTVALDGALCRWTAAPIDLRAREGWGTPPTAFQIDARPIRGLLAAMIGGRPLTIGLMASNGIDVTAASALLATGLLIVTDLPGCQDPIVGWLADRVEETGVSKFGPLLTALRTLESSERRGYASLTPDDAVEHLSQARTAVEAVYAAVGMVAPIEVRPPLFHAVKLPDRVHRAGAGPMNEIIAPHRDAISALLRIARVASRNAASQTILADSFVREHGKDGRVNALAFFARHASDAPTLWSDAANPLRALFASRGHFDAAGTLHVDPREILETERAALRHLADRSVSLGFQVQASTRDGVPVLVLNRTFPGALRMQARYLGAGELRGTAVGAYLRHIEPAGRFVALPATAGVTGSLHLSVVDEELALPGVDRDRAVAAAIRIEDTTAILDQRAHRVVLIDRDGHRITPAIFGAVNPALLPPLVRRLAENGAASPLPLYATMWLARDVAARRPLRQALAMIPEVRVAGLVITRETMIYASEDLPAEDDPVRFRSRMIAFLEERGLPRQLFIRFPDGPLVDRLANRAGMSAARTRRVQVKIKPAYFDFDDPIYAAILRQRLSAGVPLVSVQSCTPHPGDGDGFAREYQFEAALAAGRP